jgi:hypothetical protein
MTLRDLLEIVATVPMDAQGIVGRTGLKLLDVRAAFAYLARKGLTMPVGGGCWGLATRDLQEAIALADRERVDLSEGVEGFRKGR